MLSPTIYTLPNRTDNASLDFLKTRGVVIAPLERRVHLLATEPVDFATLIIIANHTSKTNNPEKTLICFPSGSGKDTLQLQGELIALDFKIQYYSLDLPLHPELKRIVEAYDKVEKVKIMWDSGVEKDTYHLVLQCTPLRPSLYSNATAVQRFGMMGVDAVESLRLLPTKPPESEARRCCTCIII